MRPCTAARNIRTLHYTGAVKAVTPQRPLNRPRRFSSRSRSVLQTRARPPIRRHATHVPSSYRLLTYDHPAVSIQYIRHLFYRLRLPLNYIITHLQYNFHVNIVIYNVKNVKNKEILKVFLHCMVSKDQHCAIYCFRPNINRNRPALTTRYKLLETANTTIYWQWSSYDGVIG